MGLFFPAPADTVRFHSFRSCKWLTGVMSRPRDLLIIWANFSQPTGRWLLTNSSELTQRCCYLCQSVGKEGEKVQLWWALAWTRWIICFLVYFPQCLWRKSWKLRDWASAESERCFSTLKRIKSFLRSTMGEDRLNALAMLSIERDFIQKLPDFNDMVINLFASQKGRRCELFK